MYEFCEDPGGGSRRERDAAPLTRTAAGSGSRPAPRRPIGVDREPHHRSDAEVTLSAQAPSAIDAQRSEVLAQDFGADGPQVPVSDSSCPDLTFDVPLEELVPADSPRLGGENPGHVMALAEADVRLPPILVHVGTMRVIDGMHRLRAAELNGRKTIEVQFFHGDEDVAFALAVKMNVAHGLPLSLADRKAAAERILASNRDWSDRAVATVTGLSAHTVAVIRGRVDGPGPASASASVSASVSAAAVVVPVPDSRRGRDGRLRPVDARRGRQIASEVIAARPEASLREVAKLAGISPMTVRDVRERMSRGADPLPPSLRSKRAEARERERERAPAPRRASTGAGARADADRDGGGQAEAHRRKNPTAILTRLRKDPAIRLSQHGRDLLRWLEDRVRGPAGWQVRTAAIPDHSTYLIAELAKTCASEWLEFAHHLEQRTNDPDDLR
jgi:ParB-like chromosome segregation protein Spo0J